MNIYHFHPYTGAYLGQGMADADPLEPGNWLHPAHSTLIAPPAVGAGFFARFVDGAWLVEAVPLEPEPTPPTLAEIKLSKWTEIKTLRDRLTLDGGCKVGSIWFLSTERARGEYTTMALVSAGAPADYVIAAGWRTMQAGAVIDMTPALVKQIMTAGLGQAKAIDVVAQSHRSAMEASADPANYDFSGGWPAVYIAP
ncbi:MAG: hypothetical protein Q7K57_25100 [Burkholderiaceae bacterium]|nr:hypothetical protein [Burkholderiaceae bacterium]